MRHLHVTFVVEWEREFRRICAAAGIWDILHMADSAGVTLRFTLKIKDQMDPFNNPLPRRIIPPKYQSRTTLNWIVGAVI
jgi:hypothetical protein